MDDRQSVQICRIIGLRRGNGYTYYKFFAKTLLFFQIHVIIPVRIKVQEVSKNESIYRFIVCGIIF